MDDDTSGPAGGVFDGDSPSLISGPDPIAVLSRSSFGETEVSEVWSESSHQSLGRIYGASPNKPNPGTAAKTRGHVRVFQTWLYGEPYRDGRNIENIPPDELDPILENFFKNVKNRNGADYHRNSYESLRQSLERHLKEQKYPLSMTTSPKFYSSQMAYKDRLKQLEEAAKSVSCSGLLLS